VCCRAPHRGEGHVALALLGFVYTGRFDLKLALSDEKSREFLMLSRVLDDSDAIELADAKEFFATEVDPCGSGGSMRFIF
jgi:hypothetical protein